MGFVGSVVSARRRALVLAVVLVGVLGVAGQAQAAFPGENGRIAFQSDRDGNFEIYAMDPDGSGQTNLTNNPALDALPAWSPDGQQIAFTSNRDGNSEIYVMNADGSGQTNLTNNPAFDSWPAWSPDGQKIAFTSNRDGISEIYVMNADGSGQTNLTNNPASDGRPAWSPDGQQLTFTSDRDEASEIYVMNADGSGQTNLTNNPAFDLASDWSTRTATPAEEVEAVVEAIDGFDLPEGLHNALTQKLQKVLDAIAAGDVATACSELAAFINQVKAQQGKKLTTQQATELIAAANEIRTQLGCG